MWGFETLLVASGASEPETTATSELLSLIATESRLANWPRATSFRVVTRSDVTAAARDAEREAREAAGELPLLPLIDGVLLVADPTRGLREGRRKSLAFPDERRKSVSQRQILSAMAAAAAAASTAVDEAIGSAAAAQSVFQTANPLVRESYEAASVGGLEWSDFVFADIPCCAAATEPKGAADLAKELLASAETLAAHKYEFKRWVSATTMVRIPTAQPPTSGDASAMMERYGRILSGVYGASVGVSTVLFAMTEAVATALDESDESPSDSDSTSNQSYVEEFIVHGDSTARRLAVSYATFVKETGAIGDAVGSVDPCSVLGRRIDEVERDMWARSDLPGVGNGGRKGMPVTPSLSPTARSIQDTELRAFSPFDVAQVHLTRQVQQLEDVLGESWKGKLQSSRCFVEELDRTVLPQRLAQILGNFPTTYKTYYAATDALVLATLAATAPGRFRTVSWSAKDCVRHRPAFKDWRKERLMPDEYLTPRTLKALDACVPLSSAELALVSEKTSVLFPSDQSVIRVVQTPRGYAWLNVYQGGDVFGFRQVASQTSPSPAPRHQLQFCASFDDSSQLHVFEGPCQEKKPDRFPAISVTNSFPNGLTVTACSDGSVVQRYAAIPSSASSSEAQNRETYRLIVGRGTVLRQFATGERVVLLANGDAHTYPRGDRRQPPKQADNANNADRTPVRVVDPATNALVEKRASGAVVVTHTDGSRATYHVDGTSMFTNARRTHVLVKKAGFADVYVDIAVNLAAQRHASGERVAVAKGGLRVRSTVAVYDGTTIQVGYNTKVIAQVNGRVTTCKPSGVCVVAKDSGRVEYQPEAPPPSASAEDADLNVTSHRGVYYFDCALGRFELCDHEENRFAVAFSARVPAVSVDLAGVVSDADAAKYEVGRIPTPAVVSDPIEPHVLVLNGDGTGYELLRPRDADQFLRLAERGGPDNPGGCREVSSVGQQRVFFQKLQCLSPPALPLLLGDAALHAELLRLARPVNAAAMFLECFYAVAPPPPPPQFTVVRRLRQLPPLATGELDAMHAALRSWRDWQDARERTMAQYNVADPRDADAAAQQAAVQRKVLAAYKAARARKKLERLRAHEVKRAAAIATMETVQEGDEPHADERDGDSGGDSGSDSDAFECSSSDASADDLNDSVDDPAELLWTAFAAADGAGAGRLSVAQTRQALVHVLGVGVSTAELLIALKRFKLHESATVGFDTFAELTSVFRSAAGSAADAIRLKAKLQHRQGLN
ncbi:hypothetical protein PybrP1_010159 [[Pythium] brassicae (nom. inval.)]|nr:hypothetical protein PybrP1_010159 [[Pythium] brassicae (nom. inval.)]